MGFLNLFRDGAAVNQQVQKSWYSGEYPGAWNDNGAGGMGPLDEGAALGISAVWSAVSLISKGLSRLPLKLYRREGDRRRVQIPDHPAIRTLKKPCEGQSKNGWWGAQVYKILLQGNAFSLIERTAGKITALYPLDGSRMRIEVNKRGKVSYVYQVPQLGAVTYQPLEILHLRGSQLLKSDHVTGISILEVAGESFRLAATQEQHATRFYSQGTRLGGILTHPGKLKDEARSNLGQSWKVRYSGLKNAGSIAILEEGMKFEPLGMKAEDAQFLQSREFSVVEVARWFNVPPHMLRDLQRATFSNIESQKLEFAIYTLGPLCSALEDELNNQLLEPLEQADHFFKFNLDAAMRGNSEARANYYHSAVQNGWMSVNEVRALEDRDPVEGGDVPYRQLNLAPILPAQGATQPQGGQVIKGPGATPPVAPSTPRPAELPAPMPAPESSTPAETAAAAVASLTNLVEGVAADEQGRQTLAPALTSLDPAALTEALNTIAKAEGVEISGKKLNGYTRTMIHRLGSLDLNLRSSFGTINGELQRFLGYVRGS
jgi:HK97 family phage portal protein